MLKGHFEKLMKLKMQLLDQNVWQDGGFKIYLEVITPNEDD